MILASLESLAGRLAVEKVTDDELTEIEALHAKVAALSPAGHRLNDLNHEFHFRIGPAKPEAPPPCTVGVVKPNRSIPTAVVIPVLIYPDVREAVGWLSTAFGCEERLQIGENHRSQLRFGDGAVIVAEGHGEQRPPRPGEVTHSVMVRVNDVRAHCERARSNGAHILMEPTDFEYGERQYAAEDPVGHRWTFSETLEDVAPEDWGGRLLRT